MRHTCSTAGHVLQTLLGMLCPCLAQACLAAMLQDYLNRDVGAVQSCGRCGSL